MFAGQRQEAILKIVEEKGSVTLRDLVEALGTSESTIRRDLNELEEKGALNRVFGGATALGTRKNIVEEGVARRMEISAEEKRRIGACAAALIEPNDFVFLDAGTTTGAMLPFLTEYSAVYVTNAVSHALEMIRRGFRVNLIGGELRAATEAIIGSYACEELHRYNFTKCFMGTNGVDLSAGFTTPDIGEAMVKRSAIRNAKECYVLCTADKFHVITPVSFADLGAARIITDRRPERWKASPDALIIAD